MNDGVLLMDTRLVLDRVTTLINS